MCNTLVFSVLGEVKTQFGTWALTTKIPIFLFWEYKYESALSL